MRGGENTPHLNYLNFTIILLLRNVLIITKNKDVNIHKIDLQTKSKYEHINYLSI